MILIVIGTFTVFTACNKVSSLANINVDLPYTQQATVPSVAGDTAGMILPGNGISLTFPSLPVPTYAQNFVTTYNTAIDKILNVYLKQLNLQITAPAGQNFDYMDSVELYISANAQSNVLVAYEYGIAKGQTTLNLTTLTSVNLKNYFIQDTMYFSLGAHLNAIPPTGTSMSISATMHMLANPLN